MKKLKFTSLLLSLLFCITASTGCGNNKDTIVKLGLDNTGEEAVIGAMLTQLIETHTNLTVEVSADLAGGETVMHPAILEGELDMYPEYTGTAWLAILKHTDIPDRETLTASLLEEYQTQFDLSWVGLYGFNNSYGLAVAEDIAQTYHLETYSDLATISDQLVFGAEPGFFEREDGYNGLCKTYGFQFKSTNDIQFSLKYDAISDKTVDVINIFTTDGRLADAGVKVLDDDKNYFTEYRCGTVIRNDTLEKHPELTQVLLMMNGLVQDEDMAFMNYQVEVEGLEPEAVAKTFLQKKGLL